jgi:predicted permease
MRETAVSVIRRIVNLFSLSKLSEEIDAEIKSHIEMRVADNIANGMTPQEARRNALLRFGNPTLTKERVAAIDAGLTLESVGRDVHYAIRRLLRSPAFAVACVLSLALGIGVNAIVFSVVNALVLRPLPVEDAHRLVFLETDSGFTQSFPNYRDVRDRNTTLAGLAAYRIVPIELESSSGASRIWGLLATGNYFDVLGIRPAMGRFFNTAEDVHPRANPYAVLSDSAWRSRFGGDPGIVGKTIRLNRMAYTVLGVAPKSFHGTELWYWPDVWVPMTMEPQIENYPDNGWLDNRSTWDTWVIGRLRPGISRQQALANLNTIAAELAHEHPQNNEGLQFRLAKPGLAGDYFGGPAKAFSLGVLGLAVLVLLAACTNLASLLSARAADRQREIAIRLSIGASRARVVRQVLTETLVLSLAGGAAGYMLALTLSQALSRLKAPMDFPVQFDVNPDWRVFLFALIVSVLAGALFGSAPAWRASKTEATALLKGAPGGWVLSRLAFRDVLVVLQVALCFVLVAASLVSLRGLQRSLKMPLGFEPRGVSIVSVDLGLAGYSGEKGRNFQQRVLEEIEQLPGVRSAAYSNSVPLSIDQSTTSVFPENPTESRPSEAISANYYEVSPGYFDVMGTSLLAGRDFTPHDDASSPRVAIVNTAFAQRVMRTDDPVGKRFRNGLDGPLVEVVGVVEDGKYEGLTQSHAPALFWPILQQYNGTTTIEVKSPLPAAQITDDVKQAVARLDAELPLYGSGSLDQMLGYAFFPTYAATVALGAFGVLAIMLAITGVHGLVSYAVAGRVREIGIRIAVGARPPQIVSLVLGRTAALLAIGSAIGLVLALAAGKVLASVVYQSSASDPQVLASVFAAIALLGVFSTWAPTRRALRIDPMVALRYE